MPLTERLPLTNRFGKPWFHGCINFKCRVQIALTVIILSMRKYADLVFCSNVVVSDFTLLIWP